MSNNFCLASFIALVSACAPAEKPAVAAPRPDACTADRRVLFQKLVRPDPRMFGDAQPERPADSTVTLYEGGTWEVSDKTGVRTGCAPAALVEHVRTELARATWKVSQGGIPCDAIGATDTEYLVFGKLVFTDRICGMQVLDGNSGTILTDVLVRIADLTKPPLAACKAGPSLIHISHRVDAATSPQRTWELEVSTDGLITFAGMNPDDHAVKCLTQGELALLRATLAKLTWKPIGAVAKCAAFSPEHDVYTVGGKQVWDQRLCGDAMDDGDNARLAEIRSLIDQATTRS